jgi:hypothetical protein
MKQVYVVEGCCEDWVPICVCFTEAEAKSLVAKLTELRQAQKLAEKVDTLGKPSGERPKPSEEFRAAEKAALDPSLPKTGSVAKKVKEHFRKLQLEHQLNVEAWNKSQETWKQLCSEQRELQERLAREVLSPQMKRIADTYLKGYEWCYDFGYDTLPVYEESR